MTTYAWDRTPLQSGATPSQYGLTGRRAHYAIYGLREMVIVARYYVDDPNNRSKRFVEYVVRDLHTSETYPGARQLSAMGGVDDGDDNTLRPSTTFLPGATGVTGALVTEQTPANIVDGDQVLVTFIEGSRSRPVIIGVFRHSGSAVYGATAEQGERRLTRHKGTTIEIQQDGTYVVTHVSGSTLAFRDDGSVEVVPAVGALVLVGAADAVDAAVRGTTYRAAEDARFSAMDALASALAAAVAALSAASPTLTGPPPAVAAWAAAVAAVTSALTGYTAAASAFAAASASYLSTKVTIST